MIYEFKPAARIPAGITANDVVAELDTIENTHGSRVARVAAEAVIKDPAKYPALRKFGPVDKEAAFRQAMESGIAYAIRNVVRIREDEVTGESYRIREFFPIRKNPESDTEDDYEHVDIVIKRPEWQRQAIARLRQDAKNFNQRVEEFLAEIAYLTGP